jgi:Uroporphyrinogen decarboxylase (URO-D)
MNSTPNKPLGTKGTTPADLVRSAIKFERPERIPVYDTFWDEFTNRWRADKQLGTNIHPTDYYGICMAQVNANETLFPSQVEVIKDEGDFEIVRNGWGSVVRRSKHNMYFEERLGSFIEEYRDLDKLVPEPVDAEFRFKGFKDIVDIEKQANRYVVAKIGGIYCRSQFVRGEENLLMDMVLDEAFCHDFFTIMADNRLNTALETLKRGNLWKYGLWVSDDMANTKSMMFSPDMFEKYLLPQYKRLIATIKAHGCKYVFFHSDGNIAPILDMVLEAGFDGFNPLEPRCGLDLVKLREKYDKKAIFIGGVCNTLILPSGDRKRIETHLKPLIELAKEGGVILGQASIGDDIATETYDYYMSLINQ